MSEFDRTFMLRCIELARKSWEKGDAPFGSLIARGEELISEGENEATTRIFEHAEIRALGNAQKKLNTSDLSGCTLYTSCEPCPMCSFMIREYKISRVVYALPSPFMGGHTKWPILQDEELDQFPPFFHKPPEVIGGYLEAESKAIMDDTPFWMFGSDPKQR